MPFTKGHIGFNKGLKLSGEYRNCLRCSKEKWFPTCRIRTGGGKYCSQLCSNRSTSQKGKPKKKNVGYWGVHSWLYSNFGKAKVCEKCGSDKRVQWSKLKNKSYKRKRENFWQLCCLCHMEYDKTSIIYNKNKL